MTRRSLRAAALRILRAGLRAVEPGRLIREHLHVERRGRDVRAGGFKVPNPDRVFVVSVGKAAHPMAAAAAKILGAQMTSAVIIAPDRGPERRRTTNFVAGHPIPNAAGLRAGRHVISLLEQAGPDDLVLLLLSGGASALMPAPIDGVSLLDKQNLTRLLLKRGASIDEINAVRKRLSRLKGGGFARLAAPARVIALTLSDVPGDDPATIGSGPTIQEPTAAIKARRAAKRFLKRRDVRAGVWKALTRPQETFGPVTRARTKVIGSGRTFAKAAGREARRLGFSCAVLPDALQGEARRCGPALVSVFANHGETSPFCLIATGETTVKVKGTGIGGRNQEMALSAVPSLEKLGQPVVFAAFATDGGDGPTSAAGGMVDDRTAEMARREDISVARSLRQNDSYRALQRLGSLIVTGLTQTNVSDVSVILR